jgi:hypothetical protein
VSGTARDLERSDHVESMARAGLAAFGVVHLVLAWIAVQLALGHRSSGASTTGAVRELARQPLGTTLVWLVAVGMGLLLVWQLLEAAVGHRRHDSDAKVWALRGVSLGKAVVYGAIGVSAVQVATGSGSSSSTDSTTAKVMNWPFGQVLVGAVGLAVLGVGVALVVMAVKEPYLKRLEGVVRQRTLYRRLGRAGYAAKGVALGIVGILFVFAAVHHKAQQSGGLDQALETVLRQPFGPLLLIVIALGIGCFGLFCFVQARHLDT